MRKKPTKKKQKVAQLDLTQLEDATAAGNDIQKQIPYQHFVVDITGDDGSMKTIHFSAVAYPEQVLMNYSNKGSHVRVYCVNVTKELTSAQR